MKKNIRANVSRKSGTSSSAGRFMKGIFVSAVLLAGSLPLFSEARNALLIANSSYKNFGSLATPVNEARDLKKSLLQLGFTVTIVENGSREKMLDSMADFEKTLKSKGGIGFFHYGGHAVQVNGKNYLIPVDADIPDERRVATRSVDVDEIMASMVADTNIVILDACRNNPLPASSGRSATRGLVLTQEKPKNSIIVYSAEAGKVAQDGVFTPLLSQKILEKKSLYAILLDVRREVNRRTNGEQTPKNDDGLMTEVYLAGYEMPQTVSQKENYQNQNSQKQNNRTEQKPQQNQNNQKSQNQNNNSNTKTGAELFNLGYKAFDEKNYNDAFKYYNQALEQGYNNARTNIGFCYEGGYGVKVDLKKAVEFYKAAALDGEPNAQCNLGVMYYNGSGIKQDYTEARKWFLKSAEQGYGRAMYNLGFLYEFGLGVTMDKKEALSWYEKAASKNYENAKEKVASLKQTIEEEEKKAQDSAKQAEEYYNIGYDAHVKKDYKKAEEYYNKSLKAGEFRYTLYCKENLAKLYLWGVEGVKQDFNKVFELSRDAAEGGMAYSQWILGMYYFYGWNVKTDYKEALKWYEKAIAQGNIDAKYYAGYIYYNNLGGNFDLQKGRKYLQEASAAGIGEATDFIKECGDKF